MADKRKVANTRLLVAEIFSDYGRKARIQFLGSNLLKILIFHKGPKQLIFLRFLLKCCKSLTLFKMKGVKSHKHLWKYLKSKLGWWVVGGCGF